MDNIAIAENFSLLSQLMDINGENPFKSRTYSAAAFNIERLTLQLKDIPTDKLFTVKGIGDSVGRKVKEMLETGRLAVLEELIAQTPAGVIEMLNIKGIGPKKIHTIWKEMGIESIGELLYACNENRLTLYKGFGEKTQKNVQESIEFYLQSQGHFLFAQLEEIVPQIDNYLKKLFTSKKTAITGRYRRQELTLDELEYVILEPKEVVKPKFLTAQPPELVEENDKSLLYKLKNGLKLRLYTGGTNLAHELFMTTGSPEFTDAFLKESSVTGNENESSGDDRSVFEQAGIPYILPCLREKGSVIERARENKLPELIKTGDIKAIIHSHSNWSDGTNTLEEMAGECIKRGFEYLVISDHSQTAGYANGLKPDRITAQHKQIDVLNQQLAPFRIFKSIESDILNDGSLDYPKEILQSFDLVIASVHSNLNMTEEKAMARLMRAIENPFTSILGHMTGRLLLSRNGYPIDHKKIIDACAASQVVIEINAHPRRLDMDWRWIDYAISKNVLLSINPDAHFIEGYDDIKYGVLAAQKGGLTRQNNLSSFSLPEFEYWLSQRKKSKGLN
ncbi:MAG TPA: helix-hairpin-helix domain-containing protein [Chitinophagaceae bacterium]|nr:helix-hairpin-helix domain-containing protein [Chitinophagaceae bacterium]